MTQSRADKANSSDMERLKRDLQGCGEQHRTTVFVSLEPFKQVLASTSRSLFLLISDISVPLLPPESSLLSLLESSSRPGDLLLFPGEEREAQQSLVAVHNWAPRR